MDDIRSLYNSMAYYVYSRGSTFPLYVVRGDHSNKSRYDTWLAQCCRLPVSETFSNHAACSWSCVTQREDVRTHARTRKQHTYTQTTHTHANNTHTHKQHTHTVGQLIITRCWCFAMFVLISCDTRWWCLAQFLIVCQFKDLLQQGKKSLKKRKPIALKCRDYIFYTHLQVIQLHIKCTLPLSVSW